MGALGQKDVEKIAKLLDVERLANRKGATCVVYKAKSYYVWRQDNQLYFQRKWPWSRKYCSTICRKDGNN